MSGVKSMEVADKEHLYALSTWLNNEKFEHDLRVFLLFVDKGR